MRTKKTSDFDILLKAFDVIAHEGFESFTLEQVAKATSLSPAALIKRFKTKKNLAQLARDTKWEQNLSLGYEKLNYKEKGVAGIFQFVRIISESVDSKKLGEHARWLGTEALSVKSRRKVGNYFQMTREIFERHIQEAQGLKEIKKEVSAPELSFCLEAFVQGVIFQFIFLDGSPRMPAHLKRQVELFLKPYRV